MSDYNVLATIDLTKYNAVFALYTDLLALKKDEYQDNDRIVFRYGNSTKVLNLVKELLTVIDIPDFFVIYQHVDSDDGLDFEFSPSHCIYPWINLTVNNTGDISPCCLSKEKLSNVDKSSFEKVYQSQTLSNLRNDLLQGKRPDSCAKCWSDESNGFTSMRIAAKHKFKDIYYKINYQTEDFNNLQTFDLKLGNTCNLACKICNKESSSEIARNEYAAGIISLKEFNQLKEKTSWSKNDSFWDQLLPTVNNLKYLDLYGGEPLMSKMHFDFLKKLIESGVAGNIKIDYNTNGTVFSEKFFDIWQHFKAVKLSFSIDDIEHRFEEQRYGAVWSNVCENIKKYNSKKSNKFTTEVYTTVNTQNVYFLPELLSWVSTQSFDSVYFNLLAEPAEYNIAFLDKGDKQKIVTKLKQHTHHRICQQVINMLKE